MIKFRKHLSRAQCR